MDQERSELNWVTGFLFAGNTIIWASLDGGVVLNEYEYCADERTFNKTYLDDNLVTQTYKADRLLCIWQWSS